MIWETLLRVGFPLRSEDKTKQCFFVLHRATCSHMDRRLPPAVIIANGLGGRRDGGARALLELQAWKWRRAGEQEAA